MQEVRPTVPVPRLIHSTILQLVIAKGEVQGGVEWSRGFLFALLFVWQNKTKLGCFEVCIQNEIVFFRSCSSFPFPLSPYSLPPSLLLFALVLWVHLPKTNMHRRLSVCVSMYLFAALSVFIVAGFCFSFASRCCPFLARLSVMRYLCFMYLPQHHDAPPHPPFATSARLLRTYLYTIIFCSDFRTSLQSCAAPFSSPSLFLSFSLCGFPCVRVSYRNGWPHIDIDRKKGAIRPVLHPAQCKLV